MDIESNSTTGEHYNHATVVSVDDFCVGMPQHLNKANLKRARSHNNIKDEEENLVIA